MTAIAKLAIALLPGGTFALAAMALFRCRHRHEVLHRIFPTTPLLTGAGYGAGFLTGPAA